MTWLFALKSYPGKIILDPLPRTSRFLLNNAFPSIITRPNSLIITFEGSYLNIHHRFITSNPFS
jgi:hypothetical protein